MNGTLAPKRLGDFLSETFTIFYKRNFLRFAALVAIVVVPSAALGVIINLISPAYGDVTAEASVSPIIFMIIVLPLSLVSAAASVLMAGALIHAIAEQYFNQPVNIVSAYKFAWHRLGSMFGAAVLSFLAIWGIFAGAGLIVVIFAVIGRGHQFSEALLFASMIFAFLALVYLLVRWTFLLQTALFEGCGPISALSRSWALVKGSWWRVFGIFLVFYIIVLIISIILYIPTIVSAFFDFMSGFLSGDIIGITTYPSTWTLVLNTIAVLIVNIVIAPIFAIGHTLLYFDLRVRKEGYSLDVMADELGLTSTSTDSVP